MLKKAGKIIYFLAALIVFTFNRLFIVKFKSVNIFVLG